MRDALQKLESLDAEIRLLEKTRAGAWQARIVELLERRREIERTLQTEVSYFES